MQCHPEKTQDAIAKGDSVWIESCPGGYALVMQAPDRAPGWRGNRRSMSVDRATARQLIRARPEIGFIGPGLRAP